MIKVGIVGCGTIGTELAKAVVSVFKGRMRLAGVCDRDREKINALKAVLPSRVADYPLPRLIRESDLIVEAASAGAAAEVLRLAAKAGKDILLMSVGAALMFPELLRKVRAAKINVFIPSGAVAGLDALKAARMGKIKRVTLTTKKPAAALKGAPYLKKKKIDLNAIKGERLIFRGSAAQAVAGFPQNINVAAAVSLAGIGPARTEVRIIACGRAQKNIHVLEIEGDFGIIKCRAENVPSRRNPKTSALAIYAARAALGRIADNVRVGT